MMVVCPPTLPPVPVELVEEVEVDVMLLPETAELELLDVLVELVELVVPEAELEDVLEVLDVLDVPVPFVLLELLVVDVLFDDAVFELAELGLTVEDFLLSTESVTFTLES